MKKSIPAEEFDRKFDDGEDIAEYVDWNSARRINTAPDEPKSMRVNVDFPPWMVAGMDKEAARLGIPRQAVIKIAVDHLLRESLER